MSGGKRLSDPELLRIAEEQYAPRVPLLEQLATNLQARVEELLKGLPRVDRISFRRKKPDSYAEKSLALNDDGSRKYQYPLVEIEDQVGGRILVFFRADMDAVIERIKPVFNSVEHKSKKPKDTRMFAYETDHLVFTIPVAHYPEGWTEIEDRPLTFELQVRTLAMHAWAEPEHDITYKPAAEVLDEERRKIAMAAASAWGIDEMFDQVTRAIGQRKAAGTAH